MSSGPSTTPLPTQDRRLGYLTPAIVLESSMSDTEKQSYFDGLNDINEHIGNLEISTEEFMAIIARWRELSVRFYQEAGIEGKLIDSWTLEDQIDSVMATLGRVDLEKEVAEGEENMSVEEFVEKMWMEYCEDTELSK